MREAVGRAGWNPGLAGRPQTIEDLKFDNYFKEIFLDSDTKVALHQQRALRRAADWFLTNEMMAQARATVNARLGARRHAQPRHLHAGPAGLDGGARARPRDLKPDSMKGYTIGDNTNKDLSRYPWRLDDEKLLYPAYEKMAKAGVVNVCVHKGLFPPSLEQQFPNLRALLRRARRGQGGEGLAAAQLHHLPRGLSLRRRRRAGRRAGPVRADRPHGVGDRPRRDPRRSTA